MKIIQPTLSGDTLLRIQAICLKSYVWLILFYNISRLEIFVWVLCSLCYVQILYIICRKAEEIERYSNLLKTELFSRFFCSITYQLIITSTYIIMYDNVVITIQSFGYNDNNSTCYIVNTINLIIQELVQIFINTRFGKKSLYSRDSVYRRKTTQRTTAQPSPIYKSIT